MPLTPQDVHLKEFRSQRGLRKGYDEAEVDAFLDEVEAELRRLHDEIGELRSRGGGQPATPTDPTDPTGGAGAQTTAAATPDAAPAAPDPAPPAPPTPPTRPDVDRETHRRLGVALFNRSWELMNRTDRTGDDDAELVHTAHASLYHWLQCGGPENAARGEWLCSRVYVVVGRPEPARYHAERVLAICQRHGIGDWDLAYAYEALARASAAAGDTIDGHRWLGQARAAAGDIAEDDDREQLLADLATIPL